jgi:hypothetical protein
MQKNPEIPLEFFQVLEEEYISLHGAIPSPPEDVLTIELPSEGDARASEGARKWRRVDAARDWTFRKGHVRDGVGLAKAILQFSDEGGAGIGVATDGPAQDEWARRNLTGYLRDEMGKVLLVLAGERAREQGEPHETIEDALNKLLKNPELYDGDRFADNWLSTTTKGLIRQHRDIGGFSGDALEYLNRLLLEEAFPEHIERIANIRLAAAYRRLHAVGQTALSLSGGGIRSGTFALGIIQGLARRNLLRKFDYLSTVSGGGYIGSWLTAWLHRHPDGMDGVTRDLTNEAPVSKIDPDPKPLQYLREYSNFITPKVGLLTADTWTFVGIYVRNLLLNWLVFIPLLMAVLMIPRIILTLTLVQPVAEPKPFAVAVQLAKEAKDREKRKQQPFSAKQVRERELEIERDLRGMSEGDRARLEDDLKGKVEGLDKIAREAWWVYEPEPLRENLFGAGRHLYWRHVLLLIGFGFGVWALGYVGFNRPAVRERLRERSRFWRRRTDQRGFLTWCMLPLLVSAAFLTTYWAWSREVQITPKSPLAYIAFGLAFTLFGWLIASFVLRRFNPKEISWIELGGLTIAGLLGGLIFWAVSFQEISDPIIGYGILFREHQSAQHAWKIINAPLAWTDWTKWSWRTELYVCFGVPLFLLTFWGATTLFVGLTSRNTRIDDEDREWWARMAAWLLIASLAWATFNAIVIFGPLALLESPKLLAAVGGISGLVSVLIGRSALMPAREKASDEKDQSKAGVATNLLGTVLPLLGAIFLAAFIALLSLATTGITRLVALEANEYRDDIKQIQVGGRVFDEGVLTNIPDEPKPTASPAPSPALPPTPNHGFTEYVGYITPFAAPTPSPSPSPSPGTTPCTALCLKPSELAAERDTEEAKEAKNKDAFNGAKVVHMNVLHHTSFLLTLALALLMLGLGFLLARLINLNIFSLHGGYRNRLIRAFLGASRPTGSRRPNPFTGFDPADNIYMHELRPALLDEGDLVKPRRLAEALLDEGNSLSKYLLSRGRLKSVQKEEITVASPGLVAALRKDLNEILEDERLYALKGKEGEQANPLAFVEQFLKSKRARRVWENLLSSPGIESGGGAPGTRLDAEALRRLSETSMRSDYHIILNRIVLEGAYPRLLKPGDFPPPPYKLMHVINTTLNLVGGSNLAWQQRKAEPFSISPLHSGCFRVGYRRSRDYGGDNGISIGTAAATSGAAASSNMGYYTTSPIISLLLTLFNVRLGWWLGNPGPAGKDTYKLRSPKYSVAPVVYEAFGLTDDRNKYVYLTDGGHFENLGFYEMVLRRCRVIVVSDAAADQEYAFGDLASAVRKVRIDMGVPIDFPCVEIFNPDADEKRKGKKGMYWAVGRIGYSCVDRVRRGDGPEGLAKPAPGQADSPDFECAQDGILLYIKPAIYGDEPRDVLEYKKTFPAFPHQSTGDQFFDEPQFESYRMLGSFIMDEICGPDSDPLTLEAVIGKAFIKLHGACGNKLSEDFVAWLSGLTGLRVMDGKLVPDERGKNADENATGDDGD